MIRLSETDLALLEMAADPKCRITTDPDDPDMTRLKEAGLVEPVIAQDLSWKIAEAGQKELKRREPVGICTICRTPQRRMEGGMMVMCEKKHVGQRGKTPCSICSHLDTSGPELCCKLGHDIDPPPEPRCRDWHYAGHDIGRRVVWGLCDP